MKIKLLFLGIGLVVGAVGGYKVAAYKYDEMMWDEADKLRLTYKNKLKAELAKARIQSPMYEGDSERMSEALGDIFEDKLEEVKKDFDEKVEEEMKTRVPNLDREIYRVHEEKAISDELEILRNRNRKKIKTPGVDCRETYTISEMEFHDSEKYPMTVRYMSLFTCGTLINDQDEVVSFQDYLGDHVEFIKDYVKQWGKEGQSTYAWFVNEAYGEKYEVQIMEDMTFAEFVGPASDEI